MHQSPQVSGTRVPRTSRSRCATNPHLPRSCRALPLKGRTLHPSETGPTQHRAHMHAMQLDSVCSPKARALHPHSGGSSIRTGNFRGKISSVIRPPSPRNGAIERPDLIVWGAREKRDTKEEEGKKTCPSCSVATDKRRNRIRTRTRTFPIRASLMVRCEPHAPQPRSIAHADIHTDVSHCAPYRCRRAAQGALPPSAQRAQSPYIRISTRLAAPSSRTTPACRHHIDHAHPGPRLLHPPLPAPPSANGTSPAAQLEYVGPIHFDERHPYRATCTSTPHPARAARTAPPPHAACRGTIHPMSKETMDRAGA
ncbi:hypothetical protein B0H13DRAFT_2538561 [Mycena leptocephala]|nr:hypothetical protein B0H13DRAFT_2538561 [Mycena leptocephala]